MNLGSTVRLLHCKLCMSCIPVMRPAPAQCVCQTPYIQYPPKTQQCVEPHASGSPYLPRIILNHPTLFTIRATTRPLPQKGPKRLARLKESFSLFIYIEGRVLH